MGKKEDNIKLVLEFLEKEGPHTKKDIAEALGIRKNTLTGYINDLRDRGQINDGGWNGLVSITKGEDYPALSIEDTNCWLILYLLNRADHALDRTEIKTSFLRFVENVEPTQEMVKNSLPSLDNYLTKMIENGYIGKITKTRDESDGTDSKSIVCYKALPAAPLLVWSNFDELANFLLVHKLWSSSKATDSVAEKIEWILELDRSETAQQKVFGKLNEFKEASLKQFDKLLAAPYRTKKLHIKYLAKGGVDVSVTIAVGALLYSGETNEFYLIGESEGFDYISIIRLSSIYSIEGTDKENSIFASEKYIKLTKAMVSVETGEPFDVRIRFRARPWYITRIRQFAAGRENAEVDFKYKDGKEFLYTEKNVVGLGGLHRFVRSFGVDAIVEEPKRLVEMMITTTERVAANYCEEGGKS